MVDYIIFEKKAEGERPPWTYETVLTFCEEQKMTPLTVADELLFVVVKLNEREEEAKARLVEITPTITFILTDDPSLDEFLELETLSRPHAAFSE
jgi:hypothetical protein